MTGAPEQVPAMIEARRRGAIGAHLTEVRTAPSEDNLDLTGSADRVTLERLAAINQARRETERTEVRTGIGLHLGEVIYGNVGSPDRLDFTVIGPAVNLASRIEGLTKRLLRPLLTSAAFAKICPRPLVSLGFHPVRGLFEPEEVFGLPD